MAKYKLYGDGIHDDLPYIQNALDSGISCLNLPTPKKHYTISGAIRIHGNQTLRLPETTVIRLMADANCVMLCDDNHAEWKNNIVIDGGIWDMNNLEQDANPWWVAGKDGKTGYDRLGIKKQNATDLFKTLTVPPNTFTGHCMHVYRVKNFTLKNVTFRNPVVYGIQVGYIEDFTFENVTFDYVTTKFNFYNNDGIHLEGNCRNGVIRNIKGNCYDDMVALTADDSCCWGPIENVVIDGLWADRCHSAVRLLSHGEPVRNITIKNVFGGYFKYCIGITKYHGGPEERGVYSNIKIEKVYAHNCDGPRNPLTDMIGGVRPVIWQQAYIDVDNLTIADCYREEVETSTPFFTLEKDSTIGTLRLINITQKNLTGKDLPFIVIDGDVKNKTEQDLFEI